jgi:hypothetical protein
MRGSINPYGPTGVNWLRALAWAYRRWISKLGGRITKRNGCRLVPFCPVPFCPDWAARMSRILEPVVEATPVLRALGCDTYVFVATRSASIGGRPQ